METWKIQWLILFACGVILHGTLFILTIYKINCCRTSHQIKIAKSILIVVLLLFGSFLIANLAGFILYVMFDEQNSNNSSVLYMIVYSLWGLFNVIGFVSSYSFLVIRLYYTYQNSIYKMTKKSIYLHSFIAILMMITVPIIMYSFYISHVAFFIITGSGSIFMFFGLFALIYSFNKNLFFLVLKEKRNVVNNVNIQLSENQISMLKTVTKQTLLGSILLGGILFLLFSSLILVAIVGNNINVLLVIFPWFLLITVYATMPSIYLGLTMNEKEYFFCCGRCHYCCKGLCESFAEGRLT
eukprot:422526_1